MADQSAAYQLPGDVSYFIRYGPPASYRRLFAASSARPPREPAERYLAYLAAIERSPNTVPTYAVSLKLWFVLQHAAVNWDEGGAEDVARFVAWLPAALPRPGMSGGAATAAKGTSHARRTRLGSLAGDAPAQTYQQARVVLCPVRRLEREHEPITPTARSQSARDAARNKPDDRARHGSSGTPGARSLSPCIT
jgi:hypothetical protein